MSLSFQMKNVHDWCAIRKIAHFYTPDEDENTFSGFRLSDGRAHTDCAILADVPGNNQFRSVLSCGSDRLYFLDLSAEEAAPVLQGMCGHFYALERALKNVTLMRRPLSDLLNADSCALSFPVFLIANGEVLASTSKYRDRIHSLFQHFLNLAGGSEPASLIAGSATETADGVPYLAPSPIDPGEQIMLAHFSAGRQTLWLAALEDKMPFTSASLLQIQILVNAIRYHLQVAEPDRLKTRITIPDRLWNRRCPTSVFSVCRIETADCAPSLLLHWIYRELIQKRPDDFVYFSGCGLVLLSSAATPSELPDADFFSSVLPKGAFLVGKSNSFASPEAFPDMLQQASQMTAAARSRSLPYLAVSDVRGDLILTDLASDDALQCHLHPAVRLLERADEEHLTSFSCYETVKALILHGANSCAAAKELGINRNTLVQRIARLEDLTGISFSDPALQEKLFLSFLLYRRTQ